jgi:hypothetical protein
VTKTRIKTATTGNPDSNPKTPYWQTTPCPAWCVVPHRDFDHPDDRWHDSEQTVIKLSTEPPVRDVVGESVFHEIPGLAAELTQSYREAEPRVVLIENECQAFRMTLAEAVTLRDTLTELISTAAGTESTES